jgi:hypothetical protein
MKVEATLYFKSAKVLFNEFYFIDTNGDREGISSLHDHCSFFIIGFKDGRVLHLTEEGDVYIDQQFFVVKLSPANPENFKWSAKVVINTPSIERIVHAILNKSVAITIDKIEGIPNKI